MRKNRLFFAFLAILLLGFMSSCIVMPNSDVVSEERARTGDFNIISSDGVGNINVHFGDNFRVIVTTNGNLQYRVLATVNNNTLRITQSPGRFDPTKLIVDVHLPELKSISLHGAGNITINNGSASEFNMALTGTGNIYAQNFQVQDLTITHSGVGTARIWATNSLRGNHSGVGNILYRGNPTKNIISTGIGNIISL